MAVAAANVLPIPYRISGSQKKTVFTLTFTGEYLTGGETVAPNTLGLNNIEYAEPELINGLSEAIPIGWATYNVATNKLKLFNGKTQAEVANTTTVTGVVIRVEAFGT